MILSKENKFIFLKGKKVGRTSVEAALSCVCGESDIITPITLVDEKARILNGGRPCQHYSFQRASEIDYINKVKMGGGAAQPRGVFYNHMPLNNVLENVSFDLKGYTVFLVDRSPYSKIISWANMQLKFKKYQEGGRMRADEGELKKFIDRSFEDGGYKSVYNMNIYEGFKKFDYYIARHEFIEKDFYYFCSSILKLKIPPLLPHLKKGRVTGKEDANAFFSREQINIINDYYEKEFFVFGYSML